MVWRLGWRTAPRVRKVSSTADQNTERQLDGIELDRVFTDRISGATRNRPQLTDLRRYVREGDTVVVHSMDRLARNLDDLRALVRSSPTRGWRWSSSGSA